MSVIKGNQDGKTRMYLSISQGKLCRRHKEAVEGVTETRTNKNDKVVHEEFFDGVMGRITKVVKEESEYGDRMVLTMESETHTMIVQLSLDRDARNILNLWKNIDLSREVAIHAFPQQDGEYTKTVIYCKQDGQSVKWYYTKDLEDSPLPKFPEGYRDMDAKAKKRALASWRMDMDDAYEDILEEFVKAVEAVVPAEVPTTPAPADTDDVPPSNDDLPF